MNNDSRTHLVVEGDTLSEIAYQFNVDLKMKQFNNLKSDVIKKGDLLKFLQKIKTQMYDSVFIMGATGVGKTDLLCNLRSNNLIFVVNVDSVQIYKSYL